MEVDNKSSYSMNGDKKEDKMLLEPYTHMFIFPDKEHLIPKRFCHAFNYWLKISDDKLQKICEVVDMAATTAYMLDDIQDNSVLRRGIPAPASIYGIPYTLNATIYALFINIEKVVDLQHPMAMKVFLEEYMRFFRGQGREIFWRENVICPTEEEYRTMVLQKTSSIYSMVARLMQLFSTNEKDLSSLTDDIGLYFQIRDDYCNLCYDEYTINKGYCDDFTEGKFSFPIIHAVMANPDDKQILNILRQRTDNIDMKRYCVKLLEKYGSFKYTKDAMDNLGSKLKADIKSLGGNPLLMKILDDDWNTEDAPKNF